MSWFKPKSNCNDFDFLLSRIKIIEKEIKDNNISHIYYEFGSLSKSVYGRIERLEIENIKITNDLNKLKGILNELVDYVYSKDK